MTNMLSRLVSVVLFAVMSLALAACVPQNVDEQSAPQPVTLVLGAPASTLIPYSSSAAVRQVGSLVFQSLVDIDASGTPTPDLAVNVPSIANGGVSSDGRTIVFTLNPKAKWHDGKPVTAQDVVFTHGLLKSQGSFVVANPAVMRRISSVEAVGTSRVKVTLSSPDWVDALQLMPFVLPRHLLANSKDLVADPYWDAPVGSGPYRVTKFVRRRAVSLERVSGTAGLEKITCVFHDTPAEELQTWDSVGRAIWPDSTVNPVGSERVSVAPSNRYRFWVFNVRPRHVTESLVMRKLIASAITSPTASSGPWGSASMKRPDPASARAVVLSQGWIPGREKILQKDGDQLQARFVYAVESEADGYAVDATIRRARSLGVLDQRDSSLAYGDYFDSALLPSDEWDVARLVMPEGVPFGSAWPFDAADSPSPSNPGGLNVSGVKDAQLQRLAHQLRKTQDPQKLAELRRRVGDRLGQLYLVVPDTRLDSRVLTRGVEGVRAVDSPENFINSWQSWEVSRDTTGAPAR